MVSLQRSSQRVCTPRQQAQPIPGCVVWRYGERTQAIDNMLVGGVNPDAAVEA
jgi:hypothetical protein